MYDLLVYYGDDPRLRERHTVERAGDVLTMIPKLLAAHEGCEHIVVMLGPRRLFAVDCKGNRIDD